MSKSLTVTLHKPNKRKRNQPLLVSSLALRKETLASGVSRAKEGEAERELKCERENAAIAKRCSISAPRNETSSTMNGRRKENQQNFKIKDFRVRNKCGIAINTVFVIRVKNTMQQERGKGKTRRRT